MKTKVLNRFVTCKTAALAALALAVLASTPARASFDRHIQIVTVDGLADWPTESRHGHGHGHGADAVGLAFEGAQRWV